MSLNQQLDKTKDELESRIPKEMLEVMHKETADLELSNFKNGALQVGQNMSNFTLKNHLEEEVDLYTLLEKGAVVVNFYRGSWCPYCNLALQALNSALNTIKDSNATLVAISPQTPDNSLSTAEKLELNFQVLSDEGNRVAKDLGLVFQFSPELQEVYQNGFGLDFSPIYGNDVYELPIPATYVVDTDKTVKFAFLDVDYRKRAEPSDIVKVLQELK